MQGPARSRRRPPLALEVLEPRMLMTWSAASLEPTQLVQAPAAASLPVVPVPFHLPDTDRPPAAVVLPPGARSLDGILQPGDGSEVDRISVGSATGDLWLELTWENLPRGAAGDLSVFDEAGRLLADTKSVAGLSSLIIELRGPISTSDSVLYVEARIIEPDGAGGEPMEGASYHLQIASEPVSDSSGAADQGTSAAEPVAIGTTGKTSRASVSIRDPHPSSIAGASSPGPELSSGTPGVDFVPEVPPSSIATAGDGVGGSEGIGITTEAPPAVDATIDVSPLPASSYEAAGGVFGVEGSVAREDRSDETRVELSLVRIVSPGRGESAEDRWSSDRNPTPQRETGGTGVPDDVAIRMGATSPDRSEEPGGELPLLVAAILLPLDGRDGPATDGIRLPRGPTTETGEEGESWDGLDGAIAVGVSSSAVLGVALYAPDVTAAMQRARTRSRPGSTARREGQERG